MKKSSIQKRAIKIAKNELVNRLQYRQFFWEGKFRKCLVLSDLCLNSLQLVIVLFLTNETSLQKKNCKYIHREEPELIKNFSFIR